MRIVIEIEEGERFEGELLSTEPLEAPEWVYPAERETIEQRLKDRVREAKTEDTPIDRLERVRAAYRETAIAGLEERIAELETDKRELVEALSATVDYVGLETLPPLTGWSWYDALRKHDPDVASDYRDSYSIPVTHEQGSDYFKPQTRLREGSWRIESLDPRGRPRAVTFEIRPPDTPTLTHSVYLPSCSWWPTGDYRAVPA